MTIVHYCSSKTFCCNNGHCQSKPFDDNNGMIDSLSHTHSKPLPESRISIQLRIETQTENISCTCNIYAPLELMIFYVGTEHCNKWISI